MAATAPDMMQFSDENHYSQPPRNQQGSQKRKKQTQRRTPLLFVAPGSKHFFVPPVPELQLVDHDDAELTQWQDHGTALSTECRVSGAWEPSVVDLDEENRQLAVTLVATERAVAVAAANDEQSRDLTKVEPELVIGLRVELCGLNARPELNGGCGRVREYDSKRERFSVQLDSDECVSLRAKNLVLADGESLKQPPKEDSEAAAWNEIRHSLRCVRRLHLPAAADLSSATALNVEHAAGILSISISKAALPASPTPVAKKIFADAEVDPDTVMMDIEMTGPTGVAMAM